MRIITQHAVGGPEVLELAEVETPEPGPGEVRITTRALGVNPVDDAVRAGEYPILGEPPFTVGWDVAGVVSAVGEGVDRFVVGDRVFGMPHFPAAANAYADEVVAPADQLERIPEGTSDESAGALPLAALTAHQAVVAAGAVGPGARVLVQGAGGGVGHLAVQIAKARGAHVVAATSPGKLDFVRGLGADEVVDYTTDALARIEPVDLAIEPMPGDALLRTLAVVRDGGVLAGLLSDFSDEVRAAAEARGVALAGIAVQPDASALADIARLVADGALAPHVDATFSLDEAGRAHAHLATGPAGKVVLIP